MTTNTEQVQPIRKVRITRVIAGTGYFLAHFLEMCVVMCAGGIAALSALLRWAGPLIGYPEFKRQFPELSTVLLSLWLTVLMIIWMRIRRHEWRATLEMASTSIAALPLVFGAVWLGLIPNNSLFGLDCGVACALMAVPMLFRLDHYTGSHASHKKHSHVAKPAAEHVHHAS
jgi:hypothetical protein